MLEDFHLSTNKWLFNLFKVCNKWALVHGRDTFCADMTTTQRSESTNKFLKRKYFMIQFVSRYERALASRRRAELEADFEGISSIPKLFVLTPMLKQAAKNYTQAMLEMFEGEYKDQLLCKIEACGVDDTVYRYEVSQERCTRGLVTFDSAFSQVRCTCRNFEFAGILCRHIIKVLYHRNIHEIPTPYIIRWTRKIKNGIVRDQGGNPILADPRANISLCYNEICRKATSFAINGSINEELYLLAMGLNNGSKKLELAVKGIKKAFNDVPYQKKNPTHNIPRVEEILVLAEANERGRPSGGRIMSGLEVAQKMKKNTK
ncbi:hypothetical protein GIB67_006156 [Kingdonia uniflora]|uniref:Protein FAR1-RELATED SEQUENCE n=1 Tax=Kingdonia uniflora TaxID=39325 RepID=A0A7J7LQ83_9MAGN|nr:hypothetical protein GIB67_006156 [Kingdonia uniflora]